MRIGAGVVTVVLILGLGASGTVFAGELPEMQTRRASPARLRLDLALFPRAPPAPLIPPIAGGTTPGAPAHATVSGVQVTAAILIAVFGAGTGGLVAAGTSGAASAAWASVPLGVAALAAGLVVCNAGQEKPPRPGVCRASVIGALIGAAIGFLPGALLIVSAGSPPHDNESAYHDYVQNVISGLTVGTVGYLIGVPIGAVAGYSRGVSAAPNTAATPWTATATAPVFTLRF